MPSPNEKFKKKRVLKTPGGKIVTHIKKKKPSKHVCAICKGLLHGMPHSKRPFEVKKLRKTERRPENLLASMLCPKCREIIYQDAVMVKYNIKSKEECNINNLKYVNMIIKRIE